MPTPAVGTQINFTSVSNEFSLTINPPARGLGADFRFTSGTYTPASPVIPTGATSTISLSSNLGGRTYVPPAPLYSFDNFLFTSSNVSGQTGPTLANFNSPPVPFFNPSGPANTSPGIPSGFLSNVAAEPWFASYWSLHNSLPGYQKWTVPSSNIYAVIAAGAPGASWWFTRTNDTKYANGQSKSGGKGSVLCGAFSFTRGQQLIITVGQTARELFAVANPGNNIFTIPGRGGGGCTTIVDAANTTVPILVAGGGGGTCCTNGTTGFNSGFGNKSFFIIKSAGTTSTSGSDGSGGNNCAGAGFAQNSGNSTAAQSWANGSAGGSNGHVTNPSEGGFGGGGAGGLQAGVQTKGGGGGGYIGGNGAGGQPLSTTTQNNSGGFGGYSYCTTSSNAAVTPIYGLFFGEGNGGGNSVPTPGAVPAGFCWIKKVVPIYSNFTITFTDIDGYLLNPYTPQDGITYSNLGSGTLPVLYPAFKAWLNARLSTPAFTYTFPHWWAFQPGMIAWVVPYSGTYRISAAGGGGDYSYNSALAGTRFAGGRGRLISAIYDLQIGDVIIMAIGQRGYGGGNNNALGANANLGYAGGGGDTIVFRNGLININNSLSETLPGFPLLCAAGGSGGSTIFAGADASSTVLTGTTPAPGNTLIGTGGTLNGGAAFLNAPGQRANSLLSVTGFIPNSAYVVGSGGALGGGWPGGGRGGTTVSGGGAGWQGATGSTATVAASAATSYYWSGNGYVAASYTNGYNSAVVSGSSSTGTGYVTIQQL